MHKTPRMLQFFLLTTLSAAFTFTGERVKPVIDQHQQQLSWPGTWPARYHQRDWSRWTERYDGAVVRDSDSDRRLRFMETWSQLAIASAADLRRALAEPRTVQALRHDRGGGGDLFIFVLLPGPSLRIAPAWFGNLDATAKHASLALDRDVLAAGKLRIAGGGGGNDDDDDGEALMLRYNLDSGTYMQGASQDAQLRIRAMLQRYFTSVLGVRHVAWADAL